MSDNTHFTEICMEVFVHNNRPFDLEAIKKHSRKIDRVMDRKICAIALRKSGYSYYEIADYLNRTHPTVIQLIKHSKWQWGLNIKFPEQTDVKSIRKIRYYKERIKELEMRINQPIII